MSHTEDRTARPLVVTADDVLLDDLLRLAAAAGTTPEVAADAEAARRAWSTAGIVALGDDLAGSMAALRPPRRDGVVVVGRIEGDGPVDGRDPGATPQAGPTCAPTGPAIAASVWPHAVAVGADDVIWIPEREHDLIERFGACLDGGRRALTIAVLGGSGGCGASAFAAALALTAADDGAGALLIDADPLGGGLDLYLGDGAASGMRWPDLASARGRLAAPALRDALPRIRGVSLLSWGAAEPQPVGAESMRSIVAAGQRGHDLVVVDLPRRLDPAAHETLAQADHTLLVVRSDLPGLTAAKRITRLVQSAARRVALVVLRAGRSAVPAEMVADALELPVAASMRADQRLARDLDDGLGVLSRRGGPLGATCRGILTQLGLAERAVA